MTKSNENNNCSKYTRTQFHMHKAKSVSRDSQNVSLVFSPQLLNFHIVNDVTWRFRQFLLFRLYKTNFCFEKFKLFRYIYCVLSVFIRRTRLFCCINSVNVSLLVFAWSCFKRCLAFQHSEHSRIVDDNFCLFLSQFGRDKISDGLYKSRWFPFNQRFYIE